MHKTIRWLALGAVVVALGACSSHKNTPLSYVPADTPYVVANLKPLTDAARAGLMPASASTTLWRQRVTSWRRMVDRLKANDEPHLAGMMDAALAAMADAHTQAQAMTRAGMNPDGLFAVYGLGLSPVARIELSDPSRFHAYVDSLAKGYGKPLAQHTLDNRPYQSMALDKLGLQVVVAMHDKQAILALLPASAATTQLRLALGLDHPKQSLQDSGRLSKLADAEGYGPYLVGYLDTTRLPALIAGVRDPLLQDMVNAVVRDEVAKRNASPHANVSDAQAMAKLRQVLPAACEPGLARIAARVPLVSFGYTRLDRSETAEQLDIRLAPDIVQAFKGTGTHVPGLGAASSAPLDFAMALPVPAFRKFWLAQAEAVKAKPFICPALTGLNEMFAKMQTALPKTAMPPFGDLRGFRVVLDQADLSNMQAAVRSGQLPKVQAGLLVASHDPAGLWSLAKASIPALAQVTVSANGKPVALPSTLTSKAGQPVWIAMNDKALAIGIGQGEQDKLAAMLGAAAAPAGTLLNMHMSGELYRDWLKGFTQEMARMQAAGKQGADADKTAADVRARMQGVIAMMKRVKDVSGKVTLTANGIRISGDVHRK